MSWCNQWKNPNWPNLFILLSSIVGIRCGAFSVALYNMIELWKTEPRKTRKDQFSEQTILVKGELGYVAMAILGRG